MIWVYYTGKTPKEEAQFLEDYKDAARLIYNRETGRLEVAEYIDKVAANAAWQRVGERWHNQADGHHS